MVMRKAPDMAIKFPTSPFANLCNILMLSVVSACSSWRLQHPLESSSYIHDHTPTDRQCTRSAAFDIINDNSNDCNFFIVLTYKARLVQIRQLLSHLKTGSVSHLQLCSLYPTQTVSYALRMLPQSNINLPGLYHHSVAERIMYCRVTTVSHSSRECLAFYSAGYMKFNSSCFATVT